MTYTVELGDRAMAANGMFWCGCGHKFKVSGIVPFENVGHCDRCESIHPLCPVCGTLDSIEDIPMPVYMDN